MSDTNEGRKVAACQKSAPLKSLHVDEDADITWNMITRRYPKAAPLLYEMENVIDRAESLLQQLRSSYSLGPEQSKTHLTADSEDPEEDVSLDESTELISAVSSPKSCTYYEENDISKRAIGTNVVEAGPSSKDCVFDADVNADSESRNPRLPSAESKMEFTREDVTLRSLLVPINKRTWSRDEERASANESPPVPTTARSHLKSPSKAVESNLSLEGWAKVVGEDNVRTMYSGRSDAAPTNLTKKKISRIPSTRQTFKEININGYERKLATTLKSGPLQEVTRAKLLVHENVMMQFADTIATTTKVIDTTKQMKGGQAEEEIDREKETIDGRDGIRKDELGANEIRAPALYKVNMNELGDASIAECPLVNKSNRNKNLPMKIASRIPNVSRGPNDEGTATSTIQRSPVDILQEYATRCNVVVNYQCKTKNRSHVIKCSLNGYSVESCGKLENTVKNDVATKMLLLLAAQQIYDNLKVPPFSTSQMEVIMSLGSRGEFESTIGKLYRLCLARRSSLPVYIKHQVNAMYGSRNTVKCEALGYVASGYGIRLSNARKEAAGNLLKMYHEDLERQMKVD